MASNKKQIIEFGYDISCPFAYLASTKVEALAARTNAELIWSPVLLGAIYEQTAAPQGAAGSASDVFNPTKKRLSSRAFDRTVNRYQVPLNEPKKHPQKTTAALRLLHHLPNDERPILTKALYKAYWVDNKDISDSSVLLDVAKQSGISSSNRFSKDLLASGKLQDALKTATADAVTRGAPGVPSFWIPGEKWIDTEGKTRQGRLYWGQDRMHFVEAILIALNRGVEYHQVPALSELQPRCFRAQSEFTKNEQTKVEFWYDFSSPWAFLGWTQLERMKREASAELQIEMKPILLGALFRQIGSPMMPLMEYSPQKRAYVLCDQNDWVRHWNAINKQNNGHEKPIKLRFPNKFPIRSPTLLRIAMVEAETIPALYRACWEQNIDVSNNDVLAEYLSASGFQSSHLLKLSSQQEVKDQLRENTEQAGKLGICGVPTYRVLKKTTTEAWADCGGLVWGQDELGVVEDLVAGWQEASRVKGML